MWHTEVTTQTCTSRRRNKFRLADEREREREWVKHKICIPSKIARRAMRLNCNSLASESGRTFPIFENCFKLWTPLDSLDEAKILAQCAGEWNKPSGWMYEEPFQNKFDAGGKIEEEWISKHKCSHVLFIIYTMKTVKLRTKPSSEHENFGTKNFKITKQ